MIDERYFRGVFAPKHDGYDGWASPTRVRVVGTGRVAKEATKTSQTAPLQVRRLFASPFRGAKLAFRFPSPSIQCDTVPNSL
jgi:hypothetical protein